MPTFSTVIVSGQTEQTIDAFGGYNHNLKIGDGEFYDMRNMTSDFYPLLGNRAPRSIISPAGKSFSAVYGMAMDGDGNIFAVGKYGETNNIHLYKIYKEYKGDDGTEAGTYQKIFNVSYNAKKKPSYNTTSFELSESKKKLIIFGNSLLIFPDKIAVDLKEYSYGDSEETKYFFYRKLEYVSPVRELSKSDKVSVFKCDADGKAQTTDSGYYGIRISYSAIGLAETDINEGDAIKFEGIGNKSGVHTIFKIIKSADETDLNVTYVIRGTLGANTDIIAGKLKLSRTVPEMDYIAQCQNRLWGCRYHDAESSTDESVNEIYACKLGDPFNWNVYDGVSTDSYTASCGTPGAFTGAVCINGSPIFFKENYYHKVYVSASGAHQIVEKQCDGIQSGCGNSAAIMDDVCYYKSRGGIVAFDGSQTYNIGSALGNVKYIEADGGCTSTKYYLSLKDNDGEWSLFAYDTEKGLWHKEDNEHALMFCSMNGDTVYATEGSDTYSIKLISRYTVTENTESEQEWEAITGLQGYGYTGQKYISRFNLRMMLPENSAMRIYVEYDSSGRWEPQGEIMGTGTTTFMLPVKPRRCDHFRIKLNGTGDVRVYSFSKLFDGGTDIR